MAYVINRVLARKALFRKAEEHGLAFDPVVVTVVDYNRSVQLRTGSEHVASLVAESMREDNFDVRREDDAVGVRVTFADHSRSNALDKALGGLILREKGEEAMSDSKAFKETTYKVYPGNGYEYIEVQPDADGLGMVEILQRDGKSAEIVNRMTIPREMIQLVAGALVECKVEIDREMKEVVS